MAETIVVQDCTFRYSPSRGVLYVDNSRGACILRIQGLTGLPGDQLRGLASLFAPMMASIEMRSLSSGIPTDKRIVDRATGQTRDVTIDDCFIATVE